MFRNQYNIFPVCHQSCLTRPQFHARVLKCKSLITRWWCLYCIVLGILYLRISVCSRYFWKPNKATSVIRAKKRTFTVWPTWICWAEQEGVRARFQLISVLGFNFLISYRSVSEKPPFARRKLFIKEAISKHDQMANNDMIIDALKIHSTKTYVAKE